MRRRGTDLWWIGGGLAGLVLSGWLAPRRRGTGRVGGVPSLQRRAPDALYPAVWPLMQYGTFVTIPLVTVIALALRQHHLAIELAIAGVGVYLIAKIAKAVWIRDLPGRVLDDANLRGSEPVSRGSPRATRPCRRRSRSSCSRTPRALAMAAGDPRDRRLRGAPVRGGASAARRGGGCLPRAGRGRDRNVRRRGPGASCEEGRRRPRRLNPTGQVDFRGGQRVP